MPKIIKVFHVKNKGPLLRDHFDYATLVYFDNLNLDNKDLLLRHFNHEILLSWDIDFGQPEGL